MYSKIGCFRRIKNSESANVMRPAAPGRRRAASASAETRSRLIRTLAAGGLLGRIADVAGCGVGCWTGASARCSAGEPREAFQHEAQDGLVGTGARQMKHDAGLRRDDAGGELQQAQPQRVELLDPPARALWHQVA